MWHSLQLEVVLSDQCFHPRDVLLMFLLTLYEHYLGFKFILPPFFMCNCSYCVCFSSVPKHWSRHSGMEKSTRIFYPSKSTQTLILKQKKTLHSAAVVGSAAVVDVVLWRDGLLFTHLSDFTMHKVQLRSICVHVFVKLWFIVQCLLYLKNPTQTFCELFCISAEFRGSLMNIVNISLTVILMASIIAAWKLDAGTSQGICCSICEFLTSDCFISFRCLKMSNYPAKIGEES